MLCCSMEHQEHPAIFAAGAPMHPAMDEMSSSREGIFETAVHTSSIQWIFTH